MNIDTSIAPNPEAVKKGSSGGKSLAFVDYIIRRCHGDNGIKAALKRAENPSMEYQSWEILAGFRIDLEDDGQRLPYALVSSAIARTEVSSNGKTRIGKAIAKAYPDGNKSDQAKSRFRRLLACDSVPEVIRILRPLLKLIESRSNSRLDYAGLLDDLLWFGNDASRSRTKARWAKEFYGGSGEEDENE
jgi:CRISPR system Cascade subunit CasB